MKYFPGIFIGKNELLISRADKKIQQITVRLRKYKLYKILLETSRLARKNGAKESPWLRLQQYRIRFCRVAMQSR